MKKKFVIANVNRNPVEYYRWIESLPTRNLVDTKNLEHALTFDSIAKARMFLKDHRLPPAYIVKEKKESDDE
jgi:hypothetical protein